jgi:hypothetical protein
VLLWLAWECRIPPLADLCEGGFAMPNPVNQIES